MNMLNSNPMMVLGDGAFRQYQVMKVKHSYGINTLIKGISLLKQGETRRRRQQNFLVCDEVRHQLTTGPFFSERDRMSSTNSGVSLIRKHPCKPT